MAVAGAIDAGYNVARIECSRRPVSDAILYMNGSSWLRFTQRTGYSALLHCNDWKRPDRVCGDSRGRLRTCGKVFREQTRQCNPRPAKRPDNFRALRQCGLGKPKMADL